MRRRGVRGLEFGPWISECAAQFIPCVSEAVYHRRYQEPDKLQDDGTEIDWPIPYWWVDVGATMQNVMLAAVNEGLGCGFVGTDEPAGAAPRALGIPDEFMPIGVMPVGRPLPDVRSPQPQARLGAVRGVRALGALGPERRLTPSPSLRPWRWSFELEGLDDLHRLRNEGVEWRLIARPDPDRDDVAVSEVEEDQPGPLVTAEADPGFR